MALTKERLNEIAYAMLLVMLSKEDLKFDPQQFKRKIGNLPGQLDFLPEQFKTISKEELQEALKVVSHDLVDYAFGFTWSDKKKRKKEK